jgi:hypothetical protein
VIWEIQPHRDADRSEAFYLTDNYGFNPELP